MACDGKKTIAVRNRVVKNSKVEKEGIQVKILVSRDHVGNLLQSILVITKLLMQSRVLRQNIKL